MVRVKRRFIDFIPAEAFDIFCQGEDLESCGLSRELVGGSW